VFDFLTTWILWLVSMAYYLPFASVQGDLLHYANILRLLRLVRVLKSLKRLPKVAFMFECVSTLLVSAIDILTFLFAILYLFCALGCQLVGGKLYQGNPDLAGTDYEESKYYSLNFNDMLSAFSLWFVNLLCAYNVSLADGVAAAVPTGPAQHSWMIFLLFYFSVAILAFELVSAFTIETFVALTKEQPQSDSEQENQPEDQPEADPDADLKPLERMAKKLMNEDPPVMFHFSRSGAQKRADVYERMFMGAPVKPAEPTSDDEQCKKLREELMSTYDHLDGINQLVEALEPESDAEDQETSKAFKGGKMTKPQKAAWAVEDAIQGIWVSEYPDSLAGRKAYLTYRRLEYYYDRAVMALFLLGFLEVPLWCYTGSLFAFISPDERCKLEGGIVYLSGLIQIPPGFSLAIETVCIVLIYLKLRAELRLQKMFFDKRKARYISRDFNAICRVTAFVYIFDIWVFAAFRASARMSHYLRAVFLLCTPNVNRLMKALVGITNEWLSVVSFWMGTVMFFTWIGVTLLADNTNVNSAGMQVNSGFTTFSTAIYTMFTSSIGDDFVDNFNPTFTQDRRYGILWITCLFLSNFLFLNLILAMIFEKYAERYTLEMRRMQHNRTRSMNKAFKLMNAAPRGHPDGMFTTKDLFFQMIKAMNDSAKTPTLALRDIEFVYTALDADCGGTLDKDEFDNVCRAIQYSFWTTPKYNETLERWFPRFYALPIMATMKDYVWTQDENGNSKLDGIMTVVLCWNTAVVVAESYYDFRHVSAYSSLFAFVEAVFGLAYVVEFFVCILCMSWAEYISASSRIFDFFTTWLLFGVSAAFYLPFADVRSSLMHYANILRLLRLIRVVKSLKRLPKVAFMFTCVTTLLASATEILFLLTLILYLYSAFSLQQFGGLLYQGNPHLKGTAYDESDYYVLNFNDLMMCMVMWFVYLLCEYESPLPEGLRNALPAWRGGGNPTWLIFPLFYFTVVIFAFELVSAFIIETFTKISEQYNLQQQQAQAEAAAREERLANPLAEDEDTEDDAPPAADTEDRLHELAMTLQKQDVIFHYVKSAAATKAEIYKMMFANEDTSQLLAPGAARRLEFQTKIADLEKPALEGELGRLRARLKASDTSATQALKENAVPVLDRVDTLTDALIKAHGQERSAKWTRMEAETRAASAEAGARATEEGVRASQGVLRRVLEEAQTSLGVLTNAVGAGKVKSGEALDRAQSRRPRRDPDAVRLVLNGGDPGRIRGQVVLRQ